MTSKEYAEARTKLDYTVPEWCEVLGISLGAHKKYSSGERPISRPIAKLVECISKNYELQRELLMIRYRRD